MLVPIELLNNEFISPLNRFLSEKVEHRRSMIASNLSQIFKVVFDLLKEVELLEPRFSCTLLQHDSSSYQAYCKGEVQIWVLWWSDQISCFLKWFFSPNPHQASRWSHRPSLRSSCISIRWAFSTCRRRPMCQDALHWNCAKVRIYQKLSDFWFWLEANSFSISRRWPFLLLFPGSKRSMSLWVEYITASGYLRSNFFFHLFLISEFY